jgi:hypothetical protein
MAKRPRRRIEPGPTPRAEEPDLQTNDGQTIAVTGVVSVSNCAV